jgi:hypothetical protein
MPITINVEFESHSGDVYSIQYYEIQFVYLY